MGSSPHSGAVAQPPPSGLPPPPTPVFRRTTPSALVVLAIVLVIAVALSMLFVSAFAFGMPSASIVPFCGIMIVVVIVIIIMIVAAATGAWGGSRLPPPPPIQQPMVPAGMQGPVALSCPNCGAPPQAVDRFGVATCPYCNTRYLVR